MPDDFKELQFNNETLIVMAHQNKVIIFDDYKEIDKIKYILELIADELSEQEDECEDEKLINGYCRSDIVRMLVDGLEEESYFLETNGTEGKIEPRRLKVINSNELENISYDSRISVFYGYLNSSDEFIEPEWYRVIAEELRNFALNSGRCKEETVKLLIDFTNELFQEYKAYQNNQPYFKVIVEE